MILDSTTLTIRKCNTLYLNMCVVDRLVMTHGVTAFRHKPFAWSEPGCLVRRILSITAQSSAGRNGAPSELSTCMWYVYTEFTHCWTGVLRSDAVITASTGMNWLCSNQILYCGLTSSSRVTPCSMQHCVMSPAISVLTTLGRAFAARHCRGRGLKSGGEMIMSRRKSNDCSNPSSSSNGRGSGSSRPISASEVDILGTPVGALPSGIVCKSALQRDLHANCKLVLI